MWAGKTKDGGTGPAGLGGRAVIDGPSSKPGTARYRAASQWVGAGGGALRGAGKDRVRGGGLQKERSGCCSMAEKPPVF